MQKISCDPYGFLGEKPAIREKKRLFHREEVIVNVKTMQKINK